MCSEPEWLRSWVLLKPGLEGMEVNFAELPGETGIRAVKLTALWQSEDRETAECLLEMPLADERIQLLWKPHLAPEADMVIGDLLFRSPAIVLRKNASQFALFPDLDALEAERTEPHVMDCVEWDRRMFYGLSRYEKQEHVYHRKSHKTFRLRRGRKLFSVYLVEWDSVPENSRYSAVSEWIWRRFAEPRMKQNGGEHSHLTDLAIYVDYAYGWAFRRWESIVWQQFWLGDQEVGGPVFIVRGAQAPGCGEENVWREHKSLWNQAWFCGLRSAYGYRLWGERKGDADLIRRAELNKEFALAAPQRDGLFPAVYVADAHGQWEHGAWARRLGIFRPQAARTRGLRPPAGYVLDLPLDAAMV